MNNNILNNTDSNLLGIIANFDSTPLGAYNVRKNGQSVQRSSTENVTITSKTDKAGIDIFIKPATKGETVYIPVIITESGVEEMVYNDFFIGEDCDVLIVAGCGIHNCGDHKSEHNGVHTFHIGKNAKIKYVEKHYGDGEGTGERIMNPQTKVFMDEGSYCEMETVQIKGVDSTVRENTAVLKANATLILTERMMTHENQTAHSDVLISLDGEGASARVISRTVAKDNSVQVFYPKVVGNASCKAHVQCDSIIMDSAKVRSIPEISANHPDAQLVHEAAIGKIAGEQLIKLMTLGLSEEQAEEVILQDFLK